MSIHCVAVNCTNNKSKKIEGLRFHRFPMRDMGIRKKWIAAVRRKDWMPTKYSYLCSAHFLKEDYKPFYVDGRHELKEEAVPTIFNYAASKSKRKILRRSPPLIVKIKNHTEPKKVQKINTTLSSKNTNESRDFVSHQTSDEPGVTTNQILPDYLESLITIDPVSLQELQEAVPCHPILSKNQSVTTNPIVPPNQTETTTPIHPGNLPNGDEPQTSFPILVTSNPNSPEHEPQTETGTTYISQFLGPNVMISQIRSETTFPLSNLTMKSKAERKPGNDVAKELRKKVKVLHQQVRRRNKTIERLKSQLKESKSTKAIKTVEEVVEENFEGFPLEFVRSQMKLNHVKDTAKSYSDEMKQFALTLYHHSSKSYKYLRSQFHLPHPSRIRTWLRESSKEMSANHSDAENIDSQQEIEDTGSILHETQLQNQEICDIAHHVEL